MISCHDFDNRWRKQIPFKTHTHENEKRLIIKQVVPTDSSSICRFDDAHDRAIKSITCFILNMLMFTLKWPVPICIFY